jgi:hypothetical protein
VRLGDKEQAITWLEKAYQEHAIGLHSLKIELGFCVHHPLAVRLGARRGGSPDGGLALRMDLASICSVFGS